MIKKTVLHLILLSFLSCYQVGAQATLSTAEASIIGVWKGTSICQIKNSPCHDENVVYRISKAHGIDSFDVSASKIVNGKEDDMGIIHFKFDNTASQLTSSDYGLWTLHLRDKVLDGTLTVDGKLYRIVKVSKQN